MAPNPRVLNAFRAMRDLGIIEEKTKPVLKKLLNVYEKNWELIEAENYRALADAILEEEETEAAKDRRKPEKPNRDEVLEEETQIHEEPVRPLKRLRLKHQDDLASPSSDNSSPFLGATALKKPKVEADELGQAHPTAPQETNSQKLTVIQSVPSPPVTRSKGKQPVLSQFLTVQERCVPSQNPPADTCLDVMKRTALNTNSSPLRLRDREEGAPLPQSVQRDKSFISESSSQGVRFMESMVEVGKTLLPKQKDLKNITLIEPKDEPFTDEIPEFEVPLAVFRPDPLPQGNSSSGNVCIDEPDGQPTSDPNARNESIPVSSLELTKTPEEASANLEMASSASGEVKISLSCNSIIGRPGFRMPSLDEFSQTVEDSCLRSYKFLDKSFSVKNLMKDMCECFLELGTDSYSKFQEIVNVTPALHLVKNNAALDSVISMGRPVIPSNGPRNMPLDTEVAIPRMPANEIVEHDDGGKIHCMVNKASEIDDLDHGNSQSIGVFQKQQSAENAKSLDDFNDIAKGHESVIISYANEVNSECPPSFHYIPRNVVFQNAYVNFSLARIGESCCETCSGDCLLSLTPCACTCETGGEYAYTLEGLVKEELLEECISMNRDPKKHCLFYCKVCPLERSKNEDTSEPCKGHLVRKFIKECWWKCGCSKQCGNRVVQRGINRKLQVFMTPGGKGWGIRTLEDLPKGAFVCEYVGEVLTNAELYDRVSESSDNQSHSYPVLLDADWGSEGVLKDDEALCLDATHYGNVARFINHRCFDSTMVEIPVEVETPDHHYYHLAFFTTRKVKALEELTWDYGIDFDDHEHPVKAFRCRCGSKFCRNIKRSSRSRRK